MSGSHTVVAGDTLSGIAKQYGLELDDLVTWNKIKDPSLIVVGQKIELSGHDEAPTPSGEAYTVASGDTFSEIGQMYGVDYKVIMKANGYDDPTKLQAGATITIPYRSHVVVAGDTLSEIGQKYGVDYKAVMELNGYDDPAKLPVDAKLVIPFS
ncbi:MAG: LysM peptidoglycan-binding domain-containing protein [Jiangellaceae bacterium]